MTAEAQDELIKRLVGKIDKNQDEIIELEEDGTYGADVIVCAYGISARVARIAVERARDEGIRAGMLRLITVWPFPENRIRQLARRAEAFVVPEINCGQIALEVERCADGRARTIPVPHMGGRVHNPDSILHAIVRGAR